MDVVFRESGSSKILTSRKLLHKSSALISSLASGTCTNMSTTGSDFDNSSQSDDSEYNFISGYILPKDDAECGDQAAEGSSDDDNSVCDGIAYAGEPLADEKWLKQYQKEENERREVELQFLKRIDGSLEVSKW